MKDADEFRNYIASIAFASMLEVKSLKDPKLKNRLANKLAELIVAPRANSIWQKNLDLTIINQEAKGGFFQNPVNNIYRPKSLPADLNDHIFSALHSFSYSRNNKRSPTDFTDLLELIAIYSFNRAQKFPIALLCTIPDHACLFNPDLNFLHALLAKASRMSEYAFRTVLEFWQLGRYPDLPSFFRIIDTNWIDTTTGERKYICIARELSNTSNDYELTYKMVNETGDPYPIPSDYSDIFDKDVIHRFRFINYKELLS